MFVVINVKLIHIYKQHKPNLIFCFDIIVDEIDSIISLFAAEEDGSTVDYFFT